MQNMRAPFGAAILYLAIAAALAALGGGWLALGRIDPLFLLPGLGWATFAGLAVHRGGWRQALGWAAALTILSALLVLLLAVPGTDMPWGAWGLSFSGALLLLLGWQSAAAWLTRRAAARWLRCILGIAGAIIWLQAMGRALPYAYDIAPPPAKARVALMSALPLGGQMASFGADARRGGDDVRCRAAGVIGPRTRSCGGASAYVAFGEGVNAVLAQRVADGRWQASYDRWLAPALGAATAPTPSYGRAAS